MSKRQQIIDAIKTRLQTIKIANGYSTNIGNNVFEWKHSPVSAEKASGLVFRDVSNTIEIGVLGRFRWKLGIEIEIITAGGTASADIRKMIADVYKAINADIFWNGLALNTEQPEDEMQIIQEEKTIAGVLIRFSILYDVPAWEM